MSKILSIQLVTKDGSEYIPYLFESLQGQSFNNWKLSILDNNSEDNTVELIENELEDLDADYDFEQRDRNLGFANAHNRLFRQTSSKYILLLNQDMYLEENCLKILMNFMEKNNDVAAAAPKLMRWNFDDVEENGLRGSFSDQIDTLGLRVYRSRRVIEQYAQSSWDQVQKSFNSEIVDVFGVSGALAIFRKSSLDNTTFRKGNFLDENYHSYKEDVDLAFRLQSAGFQSKVLLRATAYHDRSVTSAKNNSNLKTMKNKQEHSSWANYHSYKNHLMTIYKNEYWQNFLLDFPFILWYELKKLVWYLLFDTSVLKGLIKIWSLKKELRKKRKNIKNNRVKNYKEIRKHWI